MTIRFCPDCGAECGPEDEACRDCSFPLRIVLVTDRGHLRIQKAELTRWNRIAQILRRNGIKVEMRPDSAQAKYLFWWALPGMGALFFLLTLLLGGRMVDSIWPPPDPSKTVVIGSKNNSATGNETEASTDPEQKPLDTQFLMDALGSSNEQKIITQDLNINPDEFTDREILNEGDIQRIAKACLLTVTVGNDSYYGALLTDRGLFLTDVNALNGAFQRVKRTFEEDGQLKQEMVFIVPQVGVNGPGNIQAEKLGESEGLGIALMQAPLKTETFHTMDFDREMMPGEVVYIATQNLGDVELTECELREPIARPGDVTLWSLNRPINKDASGAPVFSQDGKLVGVLVGWSGDELVLPLLQLREREPQLFRQLIE